MTRGIYVLANDRVADHALALLASIRAYDSETPVVLIPYDEHSTRVADLLRQHFRVQTFADAALLERLDAAVRRIFGATFFRRPQNFRKQACWFGPFDEFLYLDADIVVFERIIAVLDALRGADFVCCDDQHVGGLVHVFTPRIVDAGLLEPAVLGDVFNAGLWGARKGVLTEAALYAAWEDCARHRDALDFAHGGSDQPVFNYVVLARVPRRRNLFRTPGEPRMWAGTAGFVRSGARLVDPSVNRPLRFLHWAGQPIRPGGPYWDVWCHYRFLRPGVPPRLSAQVAGEPSWRRLRRAVTQAWRGARAAVRG